MENHHLSSTEYRSYFEKGITFKEYVAKMTAEVENKVESTYAQYIPMNLHRVNRITKTFKIQAEVVNALSYLEKPINWLIISEHWCGDASQTVPIMAAIAAASEGKINLRIVYRDENPALMDAHLTNGGKSIAKLVQLDENFQLLGEWGPRPTEAQALVMNAKAEGIPHQTFVENLHKWYAQNKGMAIQIEILELLKIKVLV